MGQRSQIYVRWNTRDNKKYLVPRYYSWNFGTRMVSRARGIIEWLKGSGEYLWDNGNIEKLRRIMDTNFDYKDVILGQDIIDEWLKYDDEKDDFAGWVFTGQDNNNGQLLIDMKIDWETGKVKFKYAFITSDDDGKVMDGNEYMQWDESGEDDAPWEENKYIKKEVGYTKRNISFISRNAKLMTWDEVQEFINYPYELDMKLVPLPFE